MTATATIETIWCLRQGTGADSDVNQALCDIIPAFFLEEIGERSLADFVKGLPGVARAMDSAHDDPDDLYLTADTSGKLDHSIWPPGYTTVDMRADQSVAPGLCIPVSHTQNLSLWDHDIGSGDDHLGSITIFEAERGGGELVKLAKSDDESSYYYIKYRVD
ncbi:hypothetical protein [Sinosporangium siamense]|uniref:Uncharacterized protein n=1 Tax=Sinosporangium siamense TaxID=1367973 RepID=A0A919VEA9_9ACTN|nr:hypothetical protein [Sinosporangium siamense]GII94939.1 hypothetical protein Ssi02_51700 [Sinosporangium siamense]